MSLIRLCDIQKEYKGRNELCKALNGVSLHIPKSQYISIVGKSGSGKSTLLKIIGMMDFDYEGSFLFNDEQVEKMNDLTISNIRKKIGFIFQDFQLIDRFTIRKNMEIASIIKQNKANKDEIEKLLKMVGMLDKMDNYPDELSGGQKQRVAIARAMLANPSLVIADEPTGAVDKENAKYIMDFLDEIHNTSKATIVLVTHDLDIAKRANRQIVLGGGAILSDKLLME